MYPNLLGQKAYHNMTNADMAKVIGVSQRAYAQKMKTGEFTYSECKSLCKLFDKSFSYLFATDAEIQTLHDRSMAVPKAG